MITRGTETVPGHYRRTEVDEGDNSTDQGITGHDEFGMFLGIG
jgi:hypothetical protein